MISDSGGAAGRLVALAAATPIDINYGFILKRDRLTSPVAKAFMKIVRTIESGILREATVFETA